MPLTARGKRAQGSNDLESLFPDQAPTTAMPMDVAARRKGGPGYDAARVKAALGQKDPHLDEVDPSTLTATQPGLTRAGVAHYLSHGQFSAYSDEPSAGNTHPVVYNRDDGTNLLLSGHHRAAAALLAGTSLKALRVQGPAA